MKHIRKNAEPQTFTEWKMHHKDNKQLHYGMLVGDLKQEVKDALLAEQGYICCYCERRLTNHNSHIEHLRPQSDPAADPLDYTNLLCSCQKLLDKGAPRHCGNLKGQWYDEELLVSPLDPSCETRFAFNADGKIKPAQDQDLAAQETIERLGLGIPKLNNLRASAIEPFLDESLSADELKLFVENYLEKNSSGMFGEFWGMIRYLFGDQQQPVHRHTENQKLSLP